MVKVHFSFEDNLKSTKQLEIITLNIMVFDPVYDISALVQKIAWCLFDTNPIPNNSVTEFVQGL